MILFELMLYFLLGLFSLLNLLCVLGGGVKLGKVFNKTCYFKINATSSA